MNQPESLICEELPGLVIEGARIIDPYSGRDEIGDVFVADGRVSDSAPKDARRFRGAHLIVCPGLADLHVHLREPGQTHKETIETGTAAAAAGGFTYVACMPNTRPPLDAPEPIRRVLDSAAKGGHCRVGPTGTITRDRAGAELTDFAALREAGAVAFTDDGDGVERDDVMRRAFEVAAELGVVLIQHCEYRHISAGGVMHAGEVSKRLGLPGLDPRSEEAMIERDLDLCRETGGRYHVAHISTAQAVDLVRSAKAEGLPVTAEVCTHHLVLTDEACADGDPNTKMHPPLRPHDDVEACRAGLLDGAIDCIVTDHAPHAADEKNAGFLAAPPGIVGLETALALAAHAMSEAGWDRIIRWYTAGPTDVLNLEKRPITVGRIADLTIIDTEAAWTVEPERFVSKSHNTPFGGWKLKGRPLAVVNARMVRYRASAADGSDSIV
ncbi:MAG: dihydroorotase [Phycisphaerae bacterium]